MSIEEFINKYYEEIVDLMKLTNPNNMNLFCWNIDQEEIEDFLMNNEEMSRLMYKEGVEL